MLSKSDFVSQASKLAWDAFKTTGEIGYYMLYANIEHPPKELQEIKDDGMDR